MPYFLAADLITLMSVAMVENVAQIHCTNMVVGMMDRQLEQDGGGGCNYGWMHGSCGCRSVEEQSVHMKTACR